MTELLNVPAKKGADVDTSGPLASWIKSTFGASDSAQNIGDVAEFQKLRQAAVRPSDRGENAAQACAK